MKELSIEEKAERYNKAIKIAKKYHNGTLKDVMETIFPELKESEDERIRRWIIDDIRYNMNNEPLNNSEYKKKAEKAIAWLEKCEQKPSNNHFTPEQADILDKHIDEFIKQNPADNVEPKFKVGDWVTNGDYTWKIIEVNPLDYILQSQDGNIVDDTISHVDEQFHSFTIEDAKDGDVLINWNNTTFIFKAIEDETVKFHIAYNEKWDSIKTPSTKLSHLGLPEPQFEFHPSTIEQRNLLFQKMEEAGYEFDFEKKKLKKIEESQDIKNQLMSDITNLAKDYITQESAEWSEEDKTIITNIIIMLKEGASLHFNKKDIAKSVDWLNSLRNRYTLKPSNEHYELEEFAKIVRSNLTGISKDVQELFESKYLQLTGNKMYGGFKD